MKKILVAEDDVFLSKVYKSKLSKIGYEVVPFVNGYGVSKVAKEKKPDLIVLDLVMPEKDGFEVLTELQEEGITDIPILVLSNLGQKTDIEKATELGADYYMIKSNFSFKQISEKINEILS